MPNRSLPEAKISEHSLLVKKKIERGIDSGGWWDQKFASRRNIRQDELEILAKMRRIDYIGKMSVGLFLPAAKAGTMVNSFLLR